MCEIVWLPKFLVWSFVAASLVLALVSRKLNDHLLIPPEAHSGPFAVFYRRKYHVKLAYLRDPARHFDAGGQRSAKLFVRLLVLTLALFVALAVTINRCG